MKTKCRLAWETKMAGVHIYKGSHIFIKFTSRSPTNFEWTLKKNSLTFCAGGGEEEPFWNMPRALCSP